ncbi:MAG: FCD domain-containing protein [Pseudolabrys sp.]|nr:FCD domain-containing protein [Pseudolabrys sp.]
MSNVIPGPGLTIAQQVYETLKGDLLAGAYPPGMALLTRNLLADYGCGISPLREALARLVGEGLLLASGHRGVRVPLPSVDDLNDLYRIRTLLECEALRLAMANGDADWEARAVAACHRLEKAPLPPPGAGHGPAVVAWERHHRAFHSALIAAANAPHLLRLVDQMVDQTERYRALRLVRGERVKLTRDIVAEHRALLDATLARNTGATALLAEHLERTRAFVAQLLAVKPEPKSARRKARAG